VAVGHESLNPYVGPRPFERAERALFFGRGSECSRVLSLLFAHRVVLLYAQSGVGKSSLVNAGLVPRLEESGFDILPVARVRGVVPDGAGPQEVPNIYVFHALNSLGAPMVPGYKPEEATLALYLGCIEHQRDEAGFPKPRALVFDQLEDVFTLYPERWRERVPFFDQLWSAVTADPLLRILLVMREDFLAHMDSVADCFLGVSQARVRLEPLRKDAALLAVTEPLRGTGRHFAPGVAERLVDDLACTQAVGPRGEPIEVDGETVEPVHLQIVCSHLWQSLPQNAAVITSGHMHYSADINQALTHFYERAVRKAAEIGKAREARIHDLIDSHLITPFGTRGMVLRERERTAGVPNAVVDALEDMHLIRGEWRSGARWYELTHDRFIEPIKQYSTQRRAAARRRGMLLGLSIYACGLSLYALSFLLFKPPLSFVLGGSGAVLALLGALVVVGRRPYWSVIKHALAKVAVRTPAPAKARPRADLEPVRRKSVSGVEGANNHLKEVQMILQREPVAIGVLGPGRTSPPQVVLVSPLLSGIRDWRSLTFRWERMERAIRYVVHLLDTEGGEVSVEDTSCPNPFGSLDAGRRYGWTVRGVDAAGRSLSTRVGGFWILTDAEKRRVEDAEAKLAPAIERASLLHSAGLYEEAIEVYRSLTASESDLPKALGYRGQLVIWRTIREQLLERRRYAMADAVQRELVRLQGELDALLGRTLGR